MKSVTEGGEVKELNELLKEAEELLEEYQRGLKKYRSNIERIKWLIARMKKRGGEVNSKLKTDNGQLKMWREGG